MTNENIYFNKLCNNIIIYNNNYNNHLDNYYNTIQFEQYYISLINNNNSNIYLQNNSDTYYYNILDIWYNKLDYNNLNIFKNILNKKLINYIFNNKYYKIIDKYINIIDINNFIIDINIFNLLIKYIKIIYKSKNKDNIINSKVILLYLKLFIITNNNNYNNYIYWFHSYYNNIILDETILDNTLYIVDIYCYNYIGYKLFWYILKLLENNIIENSRFIYKFEDIDNNLINYDTLKEINNKIYNNNNFIYYNTFLINLILNNTILGYTPNILLTNSIFINLYYSKINHTSFININKFIDLLFNHNSLNIYLSVELLFLIKYTYNLSNSFYNKRYKYFINLYNKYYNIDKSNNLTLDYNPSFFLIKILNKTNCKIGCNRIYYKLLTNLCDDIEYYTNIYVNNIILLENNIYNYLTNNIKNINYIINNLIFIKNNYINTNLDYYKIYYKKILNTIISLIKIKNTKMFIFKKNKYENILLENIIINLLYHLINNEYSLKILYNIKDSNIISIFEKQNNYYNINIENIFINNIYLYKKKINIVNNNLLDPITCELIEEPYYLPNDILIDKNTIITLLLEKNENPFNKLKLTIKELHNYNKQEHIIKKRNDVKKLLNI